MSIYQPEQLLEVVVEKIFPFGIFVRLQDGTPAYIRRRELALDRDVDPAQIVQEGQKISAAVIYPKDSEKLLELSRRRTLTNPWTAFVRQFGVGDAVRGIVRTVTPRGVYVRIQAGIDGYVPLEEIAPWKIDKPKLLLWKDDAIEATIIGMDTTNQQLILSIKSRFQEFGRALDTFERMASYLESSSNLTSEAKSNGGQISPELLNQFEPFLVVDDQEEVRISLANWLEDLGLEVSQAASLAEAKTYLDARTYQVVFVDINLGDADGLELVHTLFKYGKRPEVCVMSSLECLHKRENEIKRAGVAHVFSKPLDIDEIEFFLLEMVFQKLPFHPIPDAPQVPPKDTKINAPFRELQGLDQLAGDPLIRLKTVLAHLTESLRASLGIVFSMDDLSGAITILAHTGSLTVQTETIYQLGDSPVKDVMIKNQSIFETQMSETVRGRFRKLLDLVSFESCIGAPIHVRSEERYAVFFFHQEPGAFSRFRLRDAQAGTWLLAALLEEKTLNQRLNALHPILVSGQLAASFGHEVSNKMIGIELKARKLATPRDGQTQLETEIADLLKAILDLKELVGGFQELMWRPETHEFFDINTCVNLAKNILKPVMRKDKVKFDTHLIADLPRVYGNRNALHQVFLNLMLNAIQQMNLLQKQFEWDGHKHLEIRTSLSRSGDQIYVQFRDTGPGIHKRLWEKIFAPGFSTRGGSGLGLYIARSILNSFGGSIQVEESVIPLGTTFRIELPVIREGNEP